MGNLRSKKILFNKVLKLLHDADIIYNEIEGELVRPQGFDRMAFIIGGFTAAVPICMEQMEYEIQQEEQQYRINREIGILIDEEQSRFTQLPTAPTVPGPEPYDDDDEIDGQRFEEGL